MIDYSLAMHPNPMNKEAAPKAYAHAQEKQKLDLDQFAEHITSHGCVYSKGDMQAMYELTTEIILKFEIIPLPLQRQTIKN